MREVGEHLKLERLRQGLTLEQVSRQTRISVSILSTLEEGDFDQIGTPLLIRSFIRNYCAALHVDPDPLLEEHRTEILAYDKQQQEFQGYSRWALSGRRRRGKGVLVTLLLVLGVAVVVFATVHFVRKKARVPEAQSVARDINPQERIPVDLSQSVAATHKSTKQIATVQIAKPAAPVAPAKPGKQSAASQAQVKPVHAAASAATKPSASSAAAASVQPGVAASVQQVASAPQAQGHQLKVEAVQQVWIQVTIDGKKTSSMLLQPGATHLWKAQSTMWVLVGNAGGVRMQWDGQPLRSLGQPGQVVRLTLPNPQYLQNNASPH